MGQRNIAQAMGLAGAFFLVAFAAGCGLGRTPDREAAGVRDPVVAARVNGRPNYIVDVRAYAVQRGFLEEGEDLDANSDAFYFALEELVEVRLFALEAEARGLDRDPDVRRRLEAARERVLANSIYLELEDRAADPGAVERLYRENTSELGQGQEIHLRHIQFDSREAAEAAKRRLDNGEPFERLAFELSTDRDNAADGGDLRFRTVSDLAPVVREATERASVGEISEPIRIDSTWHLFKIEDRRERGVPSLETLRPRIVDWLRFREISTLHEELERGARIERLRGREERGVEPGGEVTAPADAQTPPPEPAPRPAPDAGSAPGTAPPPFPFPMGGGAAQPPPPRPVTPSEPPAAPATQDPAP
jgi:peptidyl-prolyl cis-trans isomerase C